MNTNLDPRGTMVRCGSSMCINNAKVEEVSTRDGRTGYMIVSYATPGPNNMTNIDTLRLNINRDTSLVSQGGRPVCLCDVKPGMWVDAEFSAAMTRSIPPHANASRVVVRQQSRPQPPRPQPPRPQPPRPNPPRPQPPNPPPTQNRVTTGRVVSVDTRNNMLTTGSPYNINRQMVFTVSSATRIFDRRGRPIRLGDIRPGQRVRVTHANFQTMSIPPQSPAYIIQVL